MERLGNLTGRLDRIASNLHYFSDNLRGSKDANDARRRVLVDLWMVQGELTWIIRVLEVSS